MQVANKSIKTVISDFVQPSTFFHPYELAMQFSPVRSKTLVGSVVNCINRHQTRYGELLNKTFPLNVKNNVVNEFNVNFQTAIREPSMITFDGDVLENYSRESKIKTNSFTVSTILNISKIKIDEMNYDAMKSVTCVVKRPNAAVIIFENINVVYAPANLKESTLNYIVNYVDGIHMASNDQTYFKHLKNDIDNLKFNVSQISDCCDELDKLNHYPQVNWSKFFRFI
jgi:hypothetical protein